MKNVKKKAFTLAEATISLIFLSIIAAQIIPSIMTSRPSTEKIMLKKAYSTIETTISELINNEYLFPEQFMEKSCNNITEECLEHFVGNQTTNEQRFKPYQNTKCTKTTTGLATAFCGELNPLTATCTTTKCSFTTNDSMYWEVEEKLVNPNSITCCHTIDGIDPTLVITVDVNGQTKEPNTNTGVNIPDIYRFNVYYNGKIAIDKSYSPKAVTFLKNPTNNKRRSDLEDDRYGED